MIDVSDDFFTHWYKQYIIAKNFDSVHMALFLRATSVPSYISNNFQIRDILGLIIKNHTTQ